MLWGELAIGRVRECFSSCCCCCQASSRASSPPLGCHANLDIPYFHAWVLSQAAHKGYWCSFQAASLIARAHGQVDLPQLDATMITKYSSPQTVSAFLGMLPRVEVIDTGTFLGGHPSQGKPVSLFHQLQCVEAFSPTIWLLLALVYWTDAMDLKLHIRVPEFGHHCFYPESCHGK